MVRGIEIILQGRDPRDAWAFAQRICGVCTLVHGIASVRAVEDALKYTIPANAQLIRNLMIGAQFVHDHVMHFYHLHALDWVDVVSALKADPKATSALAQSISSYARSSPGYFTDVQDRVKKLVESGQLGIFANAYWGHPRIQAAARGESHGRGALPGRARLAARSRAAAYHFRRQESAPELPGRRRPLRDQRAYRAGNRRPPPSTWSACRGWRQIIEQMRSFVDEVYLPDTLAIASFYKDWFKSGHGEGVGNFMTYGDFPAMGSADPKTFLVPRGVILGRDLSHIEEVDLNAEGDIQEFVAHSWYDYSGGKEAGLHPYRGETKLAYSGPKPPYDHLDTSASYSWLKSPRWKGHAMEVGPLARVLMLYASGNEPTRELADKALAQLDLPLEAMFSTMGRTAARALECKIFADAMPQWFDALMANIKAGDVTHLQPEPLGTLDLARVMRREWDSPKRPAGRSRTGSSSTMAGSRTIRPWCRPRGMPARGTAPASRARTRRRSRGRRCTIRSSRSRSCARSTASIPALPARCICSTRTERS